MTMKIMNPKDLIEHPYNKELYPNGWSTEDDEMQELRKSMKARLDAGEEFLNTRPIKADEKNVCPLKNVKEFSGDIAISLVG